MKTSQQDTMPEAPYTEAEGRPTPEPTLISSVRLPEIPGKVMKTFHVLMSPNSYAGPHHHPGSTSAYILKGSLRMQYDGGRIQDLSAGNIWFEEPNCVHNLTENLSTTESAEILVTMLVDEDFEGSGLIWKFSKGLALGSD